uniref:Exonuclease domain-containing protein n=2 Tax=Oryza brachyantha TaxID=4533 RepID=J3N2J7_ORYBR
MELESNEGSTETMEEEEAAGSGEREAVVVFFDVETTMPEGPERRRTLLEFGAVQLCSRSLAEVAPPFATLVRPAGGDLGEGAWVALERKGITRADLAGAPPFRDVADGIHRVLHGRIWAGHNIDGFDSEIIREAFAEIGRSPPEPKGAIDTLPLLTERFGRRAGNMKMANLANYFGLGQQIHRSLGDVRMNIDVLKCCATVLFLEENFPKMLKGYPGFLAPDDVSMEFIQVSLSLSHQFRRSLSMKHNDRPLQVFCADLRIHFDIRPCYQDSAGRPKLNIVVGIPESLRNVLQSCDEIAERSSQVFGSTSVWNPVVREYGYAHAIRLNLTFGGDDEINGTEIYVKEAISGNIQKQVLSEVDAADLSSWFAEGNMVDAYFSVELYDYMQNAGIRLVAKKLIVTAYA